MTAAPNTMTDSHAQWLNIGAIIALLAVVHIFGRFIFTPLMPYFIDDGMLTLAQASDLASINYVGYFLGAWLAILSSAPARLKPMILLTVIINILSTVAQVLTADFMALFVLRLINGISNGTVFVLAPALMLEWLAERQKTHLSSYMYLGVSLGLVMSGVLVSATHEYFTHQWRWLPAAIGAVAFGLFGLYRLRHIHIHPPTIDTHQKPPPLFDARSIRLFIAYLGAGFGYILPMTFLPTLAYQLDADAAINAHLWSVVAIACLLTTPMWSILGKRLGDHQTLIISYWMQALGVAMVLLLPNTIGLVACAIGVGGGFLGSVICTQRYARQLQPAQGIKLSALLISIYALAQLLAPVLARFLMSLGHDLLMTFALGLVAFIISLIASYSIKV